MADVKIRVRPNGPFLVEGPFELIDSDGNSFHLNPEKTAFSLCRCGQSARRPFCDGSHKGCGFVSDEKVPPVIDTPQ